jgi:hypothetical protein
MANGVQRTYTSGETHTIFASSVSTDASCLRQASLLISVTCSSTSASEISSSVARKAAIRFVGSF